MAQPAVPANIEPLPPAAPVVINSPQAVAPSVEPAVANEDGASNGLLLAGLVGLLGLGGLGLFAATGRRRKRVIVDEEPAYASYETTEPVEPTYAAYPVATEMVEEPMVERAYAGDAVPAAAAATIDEVDPAEFNAELERMIAAEPDEENPFVTPKRRRKRARALLQQRMREQTEDATTTAGPGFDWSSLRPAGTQEVKKTIEFA